MKDNWELAYEDRCNGMKIKDIAIKYGVSENAVKSWRTRHWNAKKGAPINKKKGAPPKNKNAIGNDGGAPPKNQHAQKHGLFSKWLPDEVQEIVGSLSSVLPIDILWDNIQLQYAAIIRAQKIMWVQDKGDMTKELRKEKRKTKDRSTEKADTKEEDIELEYEIQFAWDKQNRFMTAQSRAMSELRSMIKQYDEMLNKNWNNVTDEQKERINLLKAQTAKIQKDDSIPNDGAQESMDAVSGIAAQMQPIKDDEV